MLVQSDELICTAKPDPNVWERNGKQNVSYSVELSDGRGSIKFPVVDMAVYDAFQPFKSFLVDFEIFSVSYDGRSSLRVRVVRAVPSS